MIIPENKDQKRTTRFCHYKAKEILKMSEEEIEHLIHLEHTLDFLNPNLERALQLYEMVENQVERMVTNGTKTI